MTISSAERRVVVSEHLFPVIQDIQHRENFGEGNKGFGNCVNWLLQQHLKEQSQPYFELSPSTPSNDIEVVLQNLG